MASSNRIDTAHDSDVITTYRMHVSQKYLDLTKQKLELTRLPRDPTSRHVQWEHGISKAELEPLVDHWIESYDWRAQEAQYNDALPQYRVLINGVRLHFVHRRSASVNAIPLVFCHSLPGSFVEVAKIIDALCDPIATPPRGDVDAQAFHVVAPSIPGFAFSDAVPEEQNNLHGTADVFHALMQRLGYQRYIAVGSGWGFNVCRSIALRHFDGCAAIYTVNPDVPAPRFAVHFVAWARFQVARLIYALLRRSSSGYTSGDVSIAGLAFQSPSMQYTPPLSPGGGSNAVAATHRPQTAAYALTDSPVGLLAYVVDAIKPSPAITLSTPSTSTMQLPNLQSPWLPASLITWTMLYWLPGPEVSLRWLSNSSHLTASLWASYSQVALGISHFRDLQPNGTGTGACPPQWAEGYQRIALLRRRDGRVRFPAWESPAEMVTDIRELCAIIGRDAFQIPEMLDIEVD